MKTTFKIGDKVRIRPWEELEKKLKNRVESGSSILEVYLKHDAIKKQSGKIVEVVYGCESWVTVRMLDIGSNSFGLFVLPSWMIEPVIDKDETTKQFTKADLKTGDVIVKRCREAMIVILDLGIAIHRGGSYDINALSDTLKDDWTSKQDVVEVWRPKSRWDCSFNRVAYTHGELVYSESKPQFEQEPSNTITIKKPEPFQETKIDNYSLYLMIRELQDGITILKKEQLI